MASRMVGKGQGIKLSIKPNEVNNLYRLTPRFKEESKDFVHIISFLKEKKFAPHLLKELFSVVKPEGQITIDYIPSKEIKFQSFERLLWWLFKGNYHILSHGKHKSRYRLILQKKYSIFTKGDSIDKWTFGIITNGKRDDWMEKIIESIKTQNIPRYEIIVCGKYKSRKEKNFTYIEYNERADKGWITKKKNLIGEHAKYENLCILHDRIVFDKNWYRGMKRYGNVFELLSCIVNDENGMRAGDWTTHGRPIEYFLHIAGLKYWDWDYYTYVSGQLIIVKKHIWEKVLWDETKYWNGREDVDFTFRARDMGYIARFNPYSSCISLAWKYGYIPLKHDFSQGLLPKDMLFRRTMLFIARHTCRLPGMGQMMYLGFSWLSKTRLYNKFLRYN